MDQLLWKDGDEGEGPHLREDLWGREASVQCCHFSAGLISHGGGGLWDEPE